MRKHIGRYEVLAELGRGGFGHVYRGLDPQVGRPVAIKTLTSDGDTGMLTRFRNEAEASGRLRHPNIVTIYDFGEHDGAPYIVMELLEGRDLHKVIADRTPLPLLEKMRILSQVAAGLGHAHHNGIIHRDVKPANVMLLNDGSVKIMDFGIALVTQSTQSRLTPRGAIIGTFRYMAPEQFRGAEPDARSDIFSLGLICYELLSGVHPFHAAEAAGLMYNIMSLEPVPITELCKDDPKELDPLLARLLKKDPDQRYQSLEDVQFDIDGILLSLRRSRGQELLEQAQTARAQNRLEDAQQLARQSLQLVPDLTEARKLREDLRTALRQESIRRRVDELVGSGRSALSSGDPSAAIKCFEAAYQLAPHDTDISALVEKAQDAVERVREVNRLVGQADSALRDGDVSAALALAQQALRMLPDEPRAKEIRHRAESAVDLQRREARLTENLGRAQRLIEIRSWDEAGAMLDSIQREFPDASGVGKLRAALAAGQLAEEREQSLAAGLAEARNAIHHRDFVGALEVLERLAPEHPDSVDVGRLLRFTREEIEEQRHREAIKEAIDKADALAGGQDFTGARKLLDLAISQYPKEMELRRRQSDIAAHEKEFRRHADLEQALSIARQRRARGQLNEALMPLQVFNNMHGADGAVDELRRSILSEQKAAARAEELRKFVHRLREAIVRGRPEDVSTLLLEAPTHVKDDAEVTRLVGNAQAELEKRAQRKAALESAVASAARLLREGKLGEARAAIDAFRTEWGDDPALEETQRAVAAEFEREQARQAALAKLRELIDAEQFAEAARAVESALATYPGDVAIGRLRAEVEERRRVWQTRQAEQAVAAEINRARDAIHDRPSEAVSILEALGLRFPGRSDIDAALKEARKAATARARQNLLGEAERLAAQGDFSAALATLDQGGTGASNELTAARARIAGLQREAEERRAAEELRAKKAEIDALTAAGKFGEAEQVHRGAVARLGARTELDQAAARIAQARREAAEKARRDEAAKAAEAIRSAREQMSRDPRAALKLLEALPPSIRERHEIQEVLGDCRAAVKHAEVREVLAKIDALLAAGKFSEADRTLGAAVTRLGARPEFDGIQRQIESARLAAEERVRQEEAARLEEAVRAAVVEIGALIEGGQFSEADRAHRAAVAKLGNRPEFGELVQRVWQARQAAAAQARRDLLDEARSIAQTGDFEAALTKLDGSAFANDPETVEARTEIARLQREAEARRAAEAVAAARAQCDMNPQAALASLEALAPATRDRIEVREAIEQCRAAVTAWEVRQAVAEIDALVGQRKFSRASKRHAAAVARFGSLAEFHEASLRLEAAQTAGAGPVQQKSRKLTWVAALAGVAVIAIAIWMFSAGSSELEVAEVIPPEVSEPGAGIQPGAPPTEITIVPTTPANAGKQQPAGGGKQPDVGKQPGESPKQETKEATGRAAPPPKQFVPPAQQEVKQIENKQLDIQAPDVPDLPPAGVKPSIEVAQPKMASLPPPPKPVPAGPSPEVLAQQAVRTVISSYAAAFSRKDFNGITALFPGQPTRDAIRDAFARNDYSVEYTLQVTGDPVIAGDQARVQATRRIRSSLTGGRKSDEGAVNVTVMLEQTGGRWVITSIR